MHILAIIWNIIIVVIIGMLFSDGGPNFFEDLLWIFIFSILITAIVLRIIYKINKNKSYISIHLKKEESENMKKIRELAILYIENRIKSVEDDLSFNDYKKFNNIVQTENNIKALNNYNTEVPYSIREILYTAYLKKKREFKK